ncbi:AMP-binding protein [Parafrankia sp. FMc2]|uniref:AMP-binding protein n=1 Tax=Parafrankia sp. FMc2 TaxID=3233196 RepID=UPI0034D58A2E
MKEGSALVGYPYISMWGGEADPPYLFDSLYRSVERCPDRTAVVDGDRSFSYAALAAWAWEVEELLRARGVVPGDRVAVACPRSAEAVVALLAVAGCGATYVPLDIEYPLARLEHMVRDSEPAVLLHLGERPDLGPEEIAQRIPQPGTAPASAAPPTRPGSARIVEHDPDRDVYLIYTSGSTGWPKGVAIPYSCLDNMVAWQAAHSPAPDLRTAQFAPLNFDVSFQEILGTLCGAGTLHIVPESLRREPGQLLDWLAEHRVQRLFLPYVALQMLAVAADTAARLELVEVNTAGEQVVCTDEIRRLFARLPGARLVNHYGQSESAMVTSHILTGPSSGWPALPPIGIPLPNCEVLIDPVAADQPAVGELLVAGLPMSRGYRNQPELTAERYIDIPLSPHGHTRAFRTGDLVELVDGELRFLTRVDDEVKLRGVRVNLLEVDAQLLAQPMVQAAATVVVRTRSGNRSLRSAVVLAGSPGPATADDLISALRRVLPAVFVPVSVMVLPVLPRTPSGKIDRDAVAALISEGLAGERRARGSSLSQATAP